jgi:hypothetical protein
MTATTSPAPRLDLADEVRLRLTLPPPAVRHAVRTGARVSLRRFGQAIGVSHGSVRYYELGGEPGIEILGRYISELHKLAEAIGFDIDTATREATQK